MPKINIKPAADAKVQPYTPSPKPKAARKEETFEEWEDRTLSGLFRLSLSGQTADLHGNKLYPVPQMRQELESEGLQLRLSTSNIEQAILEAATADGQPLRYLLACWKRIMRLNRSFKGSTDDDAKHGVAKEAKRLCMSYCIFAATIPDMFNLQPTDRSPLAEHLLCDPEDDRGLCQDFITEAVSRFDEDDMAKEALVGAMETISRDLSKMTMLNNFKPYVTALRNYIRHPALTKALWQSDLFLPENLEAPQIETNTLLGPFFRISPLQPEVALDYFNGAGARDEGHLRSNQNALRMTLRNHQLELFDIANQFVRANKDARNSILDWFALIVNKNHKRRATYVDDKATSSDGFMVNITVGYLSKHRRDIDKLTIIGRS